MSPAVSFGQQVLPAPQLSGLLPHPLGPLELESLLLQALTSAIASPTVTVASENRINFVPPGATLSRLGTARKTCLGAAGWR